MYGRRGLIGVVALSLALALGGTQVHAESADDLARIEKQVQEQKAEAAKLEQKEKVAASELDTLRDKLITATSALQDKQQEKEELEERLDVLERQSDKRAAVLDESRKRLADLTSGLLQLSREPPALFALRENSATEHVHRAVLLRSLIPKLKEETNRIVEELDSYESLQKQAASQKRLVMAAQQNLQWQRHSLDQLVRSRQGLLEKTQVEKEVIAKQLEALSSEAKDLRQLMDRVSQPSWGKTVAKGVPEKTLKLKEALKNPVAGKIIHPFGGRDDFGVASQGVTYAASPSGPIVAPQTGKVVFAGPFKGYGKIVILQHQGGTHSFLAGFGRIDADMGQAVKAGEPLGILPAKGEGKPELYFEWRRGNEPVDPTSAGLSARVSAR